MNTADFEKIDSVPTRGLENHADIRSENTGATAAFNTSMNAAVKSVSGGQSLPPDLKSIEEYSIPRTSGPNDKGIISPYVPLAFFVEIKDDLLESARSGDISLGTYGHVSYNDVFEKRHTTCIAFDITGKMTLSNCAQNTMNNTTETRLPLHSDFLQSVPLAHDLEMRHQPGVGNFGYDRGSILTGKGQAGCPSPQQIRLARAIS
jgi:hypothetical protein